MSYHLPMDGGSATFKAAADLSAKQYYAMKLNSSGDVAICDTAEEQAYGILGNKPTSGQAASVTRHGIEKAILAGTVAVGDPLMVDANGKFVKGFGAAKCAAIALEAGVTGDIVAVEVVATAGGFCQHGPHTKVIHYNLADIADGNIATGIVPGYAGRIKKVYAVNTKAATTGSKLSSLNLEIDGVNVTGGVVALTSANQTPIGAVVAGSAITALNTFGAAGVIDVEASATTAFAEGEIDLVIEFG